VLTRPKGRNDRLAVRLRGLGFQVLEEPLIEIEPIETGLVDVGRYDWVVLTSATGARELRARAVGTPRRVAAIGRATAEAWGAPVDLVPEVASQEGLLAALARPPGRVLFAGAEGARRLLVDELGAEFIALYRTRSRRPAGRLRGDLVVLASASAARSYAQLELDLPTVTIGPETTAAARALGVEVLAEAKTPDVDGLVGAIADATR
jgi:uroporphyrinogen-III synthase